MEVQFAWLSLIFPLAGVVLTPFIARVHPVLRDQGPVAFSLLTAVSAVMLIPALFDKHALPVESSITWLDGAFVTGFGVLLDPLSIVMANVVAVISFFIMVYCIGYMKGDPGITRFWMLMNGFIGSMLLLVLANNLIFTFVGWKLVGLCSYGLIGYYYRDEKQYWIGGPAPHPFNKPSSNAVKALIVTSVGDMLMLAGFLMVYFYAGTLNVLELYETVGDWLPAMAADPGMIVLVTLLLVAGPVGKSAQFPLHEWLPEAMSGPGPVSALIHAATMVKSGVFLVARFIPIFYYGYWVEGIDAAMTFFVVVAWVGGISAFLAASQGLVAKELKKALAYSTGSQIGYMMLALGVSGMVEGLVADGYTAGIFHLTSHAMFKACLFLCAGTVIHATHSIYITEMGGLRRLLPFTWIFMMIASLSLMGVPPLSGFWSKETVLKAAAESGQYALLGIAVVTVLMTAFYTVRFMGMVFHRPLSDHLAEAQAHGAHVGEAHPTQTFAAGVLAVGILVLGVFGLTFEHWLHHLFEVSLEQQIPHGEEHLGHGAESGVPGFLVPVLSIGALLAGAVPAYFLYVSGKLDPGAIFRRSGLAQSIYTFLWNRWYIDRVLKLVFARGTEAAAAAVRNLEVIVDSVINRGAPRSMYAGGRLVLQVMRTDSPSIGGSLAYMFVIAAVVVAIAVAVS